MAVLHGAFDILRIMIDAADDDDVLDPPGDIELAGLVEKSEIAGPQPAFMALAGDAALEGSRRRFPVPPVTLCDVGAANPELPDQAARKAVQLLGMNDGDALAEEAAAAAHQDLRVLIRPCRDGLAPLQAIAARAAQYRRAAPAAARDQQR